MSTVTPPFSRRPVQVLDPQIAERIAAGEVIERPASVVKELVENSLDAGATEVCVTLEDGGKSLIEILDNGRGMTVEDLAICRLRHATSKLSSLEDLERIATLGFRGEALPSIAAASDLTLLSRAHGAETAYEIGGGNTGRDSAPRAVTFGHFLGSPHGTRVEARALFSQIPARLKFLRAQAAEVSNVREWIERLAVARPEVGFRLVSNGRAILSLRACPGPQGEAERVQMILSDGDDFPLVSVNNEPGFREWSTSDVRVRAHWLQGFSAPQMRRIVQVVNGRAVRDRMLQQAMLAPFRQALLPGQFPALALFVEIAPSEIDVNVHPTKTEIRFLDSRKVFHAVQSVIDSMISSHGAPTYASGTLTPSTPIPAPESSGPRPTWTRPAPTASLWSQPAAQPLWRAAEPATSNAHATEEPAAPQGAAPVSAVPLDLQQARFSGTLFNTYLVLESGNEAVLIDQHAADERIRYERLRARMGKLTPQDLLIPEVVKFAPENRAEVETRLHWLQRAGFETEVFGEDALLFRSIPAEWGNQELRTRLKNLVERLLATESAEGSEANAQQALSDERLFETLASEACHSAVRAGDRLEPEEARALIRDLFLAEHPWNCPHGRPTVVRVPKGRFEEWFQRRV